MITPTDKGIPKSKWIPAPLWNAITRYVPMPCMDILFQRSDGSVLFGFRRISPYKNIWSFLGGRILRSESLEDSANRIALEYGLAFDELYLVGVFPKVFKNRSDIVIGVAARKISGTPIVDGKEFSSMVWRKSMPKRVGSNYRLMFQKWNEIRRYKEALTSNRIL